MCTKQLSYIIAEVERPRGRRVDGDNVLVTPVEAFDDSGTSMDMDKAMLCFKKPWKEGRPWNVRLINVDAPEFHPCTGYENNKKVKFDGQGKYGRDAALVLEELLPEGAQVILEFEEKKVGGGGRPLSHLFSVNNGKKDLYINKEIVASGLVMPYFIAPLGKYVSEIREAAKEAFDEQRGLYPYLIYDRFIVSPSKLNEGELLNEPFIFRKLKQFISKKNPKTINKEKIEKETRWLHDCSTNYYYTYHAYTKIPPHARTWYDKGVDMEDLGLVFKEAYEEEHGNGDEKIIKGMLQYTPFGGVGQVSGSKHLFELKTIDGANGLLIDCGHDHKRITTDEEMEKIADRCNAVILTHAHLDHFGDLDRLLDCNPSIKVFCTYGAYRIIFETSKRRVGGQFVCPYKKYEDNFVIQPYYKPFFIDENIKALFFCAGHMPGSAQVSLEFRLLNNEKKTAFISGDIGPFVDLPIIKTPDGDLPFGPDVMLCESTYGVENRSDHEPAITDMMEKTGYALERKKKIICAAFSVMRTQSILLDLYKLKNIGALPPSYRIAINGTKHSSSVKLNNYIASWLTGSAAPAARVGKAGYPYELLDPATAWEFRSRNIFDAFPLINNPNKADFVVCADGMWNFSRAQEAIVKYAGDHSVIFMLAGYQAENSNGRQLQNAMEERLENGESVNAPKQIVVKKYNFSNEVVDEKHLTLKAEVMKIKGYMSHIDGPSRLEYVKNVSPEKLFLVHGDPENLDAVKNHMNSDEDMDSEIIIPEPQVTYVI